MQTSVHQMESLLFSILLQMIVIIGAARTMNVAFRRLGQPGVVGETVAGLMLGPSLFGCLFPDASAWLFGAKAAQPITIISQIGLIFLMFQIGTEFEFGHLRSGRNRGGVAAIALVSIAAPFLLGLTVGGLSAPALARDAAPPAYSLFVGVALAITAVPVLGRILREYGLARTEVGVVAIAAAAVNDVVGWVMLAGVSAYAGSQFSAAHVALQLGGLVAFVAALWFVLRPLADRLVRAFPVRGGELQPNLMAILCCLIFATGICTFELGIFAVFGGFAAGVLFHRHRELVRAWRRQVGQFVLVFFLPVFFTSTGLRTNVLGLSTAADLGWLAAILIVAVLGKIVPVYLAGRLTGFDGHQATILGALMNTRGLMELIVLNVGYDMGVLPQQVFTMLVIMAVVTTTMTGPLLTALLPRTGHVIPLGVEA